MLTIFRDLLDAIHRQAGHDAPLETCGVIAGPAGGGLPSRLIPMRNACASSTFFRFDSHEQLRVWREMDAQAEEPVVIYHSHTRSEAYPSREDVRLASEPAAHYLIVTTLADTPCAARSFRITDGVVVEETIRIVERAAPVQAAPNLIAP